MKRKFLIKYNFVLRVINSCKTAEQLKSASNLFWLLCNQYVDHYDLYYYQHLRLIAKHIDELKLTIK